MRRSAAILLLAVGCGRPPEARPDDATADTALSGPVDTVVDTGGTAGTSSGPAPTCAEVAAIIDRGCVGCHGGDAPDGGLDLADLAATIGAPSAQAALPLITPGSPADSYLWRKIDGTHVAAGGSGVPMPPSGFGPLARTDAASIERWIAAGAACDPTR